MKAIKTILKEVQEFKTASLLTPFFMILEVIFETLIPIVMGMIIDMSDGQAGAAAEAERQARRREMDHEGRQALHPVQGGVFSRGTGQDRI